MKRGLRKRGLRPNGPKAAFLCSKAAFWPKKARPMPNGLKAAFLCPKAAF